MAVYASVPFFFVVVIVIVAALTGTDAYTTIFPRTISL